MILSRIGHFLGQVLGNYGSVYPDTIPENATFPCIVYALTGSKHEHYLNGSPVPISTAEIKVEIAGFDSATLDQLAKAVKLVLNGFRGFIGNTLSGTTLDELSTMTLDQFDALTLDQIAGIRYQGGDTYAIITLGDESQTSFPYGDGDDSYLYVRSQEYSIRHSI